jgi:ubiquinone/menaquinone biosynthesis C-methylase UbiE
MGATAHLGIKPGEYDKLIATLIPHYGELIDAAAAAVGIVARTVPTVVDLGTGSGALLQRIRNVRPKAKLIGIDADAAMLGAATGRLGKTLQKIEDNFEQAAIPSCDVVSASFALHHVPTEGRKAAIYQRCFAALRQGGMLVSADCYLAVAGKIQRRDREAWLDHLKRSYTARKAESFLRTWAKEDFYFTLEREIELLEKAGFAPEVMWRKDSFGVLVGLK